MSQYLKNKVTRYANLPKEEAQLLHNDASLMAALGVENDQDFKDFFLISAHVRSVAEEWTDKPLNNDEIAKLSHIIYTNRKKHPLNSIFNFYTAVSEALVQAEIPMKKTAYPQGFGQAFIQNPHNMKQWVQSMREIYALAQQKEIDLGAAFNIVTKKWTTMDRLDFKHWLSFYQGNNHLKYKTAQPAYHEVGDGAVIPTHSLRARIPGVPPRVPESVDEDVVARRMEQTREQDAQKATALRAEQEETKKKLIARLAAAEKIFMNNLESFKKMLGTEYERWLAVLHDLKRKVQVATPVNARSVLLDDLIHKEANKLEAQGMVKSADMVRKFAQPAPPPIGADPLAPPGEDPLAGMGDLSAPGADAGLPGAETPAAAPPKPGDEHRAMEEFVRNMTGETEPEKEELNEEPTQKTSSLKTVAQVVPDLETSAPAPEVLVSDQTPEQRMKHMDIAEQDIEEALKNVTIDDLVSKLDGLAQAYRVREKTRQLTIVDLIMQQLGISSYFPNLSEAINKAFDSNQYILSRVEDILARLRGAATTDEGSLNTKLQQQQAREDDKAARRAGPVPEGTPPGAEVAPASPVTGPGAEMGAPAEVEVPPAPVGVR